MPHRNRLLRTVPILVAILFTLPQGAPASVVSGRLVLKSGDPLGPSVVSSVNAPFTDGNGKVGFVGALADGERFIWWDEGAVFFSNDALPLVLTGGESTMGVSDTGGFIYSPAVDGNDAVYTHGGVLLAADDPVPPLPGLYSSFNSRPHMLPDGTAFWIGGTSETQGGSTSNRHLFKATDPTDPQTITVVLSGGDVIDGKTIRTTSSNFNFDFSDDGAHHIHILDMNVTDNMHVYLDGTFVAQEAQPTGQGDNWSSFDIVSVNTSGHYIFTGDTDGPVETDEFVAWNGEIAVREGDTLDGVTLLSGAALRAASVNNLDQVAHIWGFSTEEHLFLGDGPDLPASRRLLSLGDSLEVTGDDVPDWVLTDFNASTVIGPGLDLGDDGWVYVEVDLEPVGGGASVEAVLGVQSQPTVAVGPGPASARLLAVAPNPFSAGTVVRFSTDRGGPLRLTVFDVRGRLVRELASGVQPAGLTERSWDGRDASGLPVPAGTYFLRLQTDRRVASTKLVRIE